MCAGTSSPAPRWGVGVRGLGGSVPSVPVLMPKQLSKIVLIVSALHETPFDEQLPSEAQRSAFHAPTMMAMSSMSYVSLVALDDAHQLQGTRRSNPLKAGQTIAAHGLFEDNKPTGVGLFFVLRAHEDAGCELAPIGCQN